MRELSIRHLQGIDKYLGMPLAFGRSEKWKMPNTKLEARILSWRKCQPSQVSTEILIQSILQAIALYFIGYFLLPKSFVHELNMIMARFWWGSTTAKRKIH